MSYQIARGEQGVLTFEPYKSMLLPLWRFKTPSIATESSSQLWHHFLAFAKAEDFVGADMSRKFIQMGMTRAKRYANHAGGRKYQKRSGPGRGEELARSSDHKDHHSKLESSNIFRRVWKLCQEHEQYARLRARFLEEQKEYRRAAGEETSPRGRMTPARSRRKPQASEAEAKV